jgi:hypothetical protein
MLLTDPPEPDGVIHLKSGCIGVEVTRLHPGGLEARRWEGAQAAILEKALAIYRAAAGPPVEVVLYWNAFTDPTRRSQRAIAEDIALFVQTHVPPLNHGLEFYSNVDGCHALPHGVDRIDIRRFVYAGVVGDGNHWYTPHSAFPPAISHTLIQQALDRKELKVRRWRESYAEVWLVLPFGREGPSTWGQLPHRLSSLRFDSSAHRAFVIGALPEVLELSLPRSD